jgi:hypothetical protein
VTDFEPAVTAADLPRSGTLHELTRRRWPSLTARLIAMLGLLGVLTALAVAVAVVVVALVVTATAG